MPVSLAIYRTAERTMGLWVSESWVMGQMGWQMWMGHGSVP